VYLNRNVVEAERLHAGAVYLVGIESTPREWSR
jgi:hypothetical protein